MAKTTHGRAEATSHNLHPYCSIINRARNVVHIPPAVKNIYNSTKTDISLPLNKVNAQYFIFVGLNSSSLQGVSTLSKLCTYLLIR